MKRYVTKDQPYLLLGWAAARLDLKHIWPPESIPLGIVDDTGTIHAVVVYNAFYSDACHAHIATSRTKHWASRSTLKRLFSFPFDDLRLSRMNLEIPASNVAAQILALKLGFRFEGVKRAALDGADTVFFGMLKDECMFIDRPHLSKTTTTDEYDAHSHQTNEAPDGQEKLRE
jgi:hypothetical protein